MSDVWQGPGWWLASDGKWYPAEASPGAGDPTPETTTERATATIADAVPVAPGSNGQSSAAIDTSQSTSGWQAVDPDEELRGAASTSTLGDDLQWSEPPSGEWTNAYEDSGGDTVPAGDITDVVISDETPTVPGDAILTDAVTSGVAPPPSPVRTPPVDIPDVEPPASQPASPPDVSNRRRIPEPIERDDAWRKPTAQSAAATGVPLAPPPYDAGAQATAPEVVDLAIPAESPLNADIDGKGNRPPWKGLLLGLLVVGAIIVLAVLIGYAFSRWTDNGSTTDIDAGNSSTSAPATDAPAPTTPATTAGDGQDVSVFELRAGDCIEGEISGNVQRLVKVDCSVPHKFEVYRETIVDPSITEFDHDAISAQAQELCRSALDNYIAPGDERDIKFKWFQPTEESWAQASDGEGDRTITCLLFDDAGQLTGRAA